MYSIARRMPMFISLIINFCILFTFIILTYFLCEFFNISRHFSKPYYASFVGFIGGIIAILLMSTSLSIVDGVMGDARPALILLSTIIGGPIAGIVTTVISSIFRMFFIDVGLSHFLIGSNTLFYGLIISLFAWRFPINTKNVHAYLLFAVVECALFILITTPVNIDNLVIWGGVFLNFGAFYATYAVLHIFKRQFTYASKMKEMADTDYLTGIANNRKFREKLEECVEEKQPFALILIDIDHFKTINRYYGHLYGDEILRQLARDLRAFAKGHNSFVFRTSGEEFFFICYDAPPAMALSYAAKLRSHIQEKEFTLSTGETIDISLSSSIVNFPDNGHSGEMLVNYADLLLHEYVGPKDKNVIIHANQTEKTLD